MRNGSLTSPNSTHVDQLTCDQRGGLEPWPNLEAQQAALELEMSESGRRRHEQRLLAAKRGGRASEMTSGVMIVDRNTPKLAAAIEAFLLGAERAKSGRPRTAAR